MVELELAFSSFIIGLSGAMMPGPLLTYVINGSLQKGFIAGPLIITGHAILELILVVLLLSEMNRPFCQPTICCCNQNSRGVSFNPDGS
ncbi:LysE family transporter [Halanaerobium hydrogeniformans]|uniref:LysE family transporter n=1 Tax=Halanaerobium hydrogeniformans TaxID=656519 RepID=UPI0002F13539|nr:LysE family transporter [Halanaerobium hydrogeniformans]